jgi:riboflavin synthase
MFSGIIEAVGIIKDISPSESNLKLTISAPFCGELKIDQSIAHSGVCLTVVELHDEQYSVVAIKETLDRTNLGDWVKGSKINLERCIRMNDRLDGHIVQGHVDLVAQCTRVEDLNGSWKFNFEYDTSSDHVTVEKGSVCVNGVSLTVVDSAPGLFSVAIIPFTYEYTNFNQIKPGTRVNIEFDIIGKYITALVNKRL